MTLNEGQQKVRQIVNYQQLADGDSFQQQHQSFTNDAYTLNQSALKVKNNLNKQKSQNHRQFPI
jgi:hypothetical protein